MCFHHSMIDWRTFPQPPWWSFLFQEHLYQALHRHDLNPSLKSLFRTWNKILWILFILFSTFCLFGNVQSHRLWRSTCFPRQTCNRLRLKMVEYGWLKQWKAGKEKKVLVLFWMVRIYNLSFENLWGIFFAIAPCSMSYVCWPWMGKFSRKFSGQFIPSWVKHIK